ncbi:MAG: DUF389 domain-containing protein [Geminocystis sp.]|nr:DUF389 domain-containing protein [Geminocystis sp.]HIK37455.1 DUF389 domain-containing protein [Geminocystis sp. M7585_C2015_104]
MRKKKARKIFKFINSIIPSPSPEEVERLAFDLFEDSRWSRDFVICTVGACLIATFGLLSNSTAVIIGAMVVAPLMLPLRGLAFAACEGDVRLFRTALVSLIGATVLSLFISSFVAFAASLPSPGSEIIARTQPNLLDLGIALSAGAVGGFAKIRKRITDTMAGVAIAVALMPPLCVVGISLSARNYSFAWGAFLLYLTNLLGIVLACMVVFVCSGYTRANPALGWTTFLTLLLVIPLGASFFRLLQQQQIEVAIRRKLLYETVTIGQEVQNVKIRVVWTRTPPLVLVNMETDNKITPAQVRLVEDFLRQSLGRDFSLELYVSRQERVTGEE